MHSKSCCKLFSIKSIKQKTRYEIGFFKNLKVFYYSKDKEEKMEIDFKADLTIIEFLNYFEIPIENKNQYILKYDYSPAKYDPLYLC